MPAGHLLPIAVEKCSRRRDNSQDYPLHPCGDILMAKVQKSDSEWRQQLSEEEYQVCRQRGTERPFSGRYWDDKSPGLYVCTCCGEPLFDARCQFESGTGWPSFHQPCSEDSIETRNDRSHGMVRTEVLCRNCESHLGHVFADGPQPTGLRYCINSVSLRKRPAS